VSDEAKRLRQANVGDVDGDNGHRHSSVSVTSATNAPDATVTLTVEGAGSVPEHSMYEDLLGPCADDHLVFRL
jgi:hypothetical protein